MLRYLGRVLAYAKRGVAFALGTIEGPLRDWFHRCHGKGASNQDDIYRCLSCHGLVTHRMIARGGCGCGFSKISPTNPTFLELCGLLVTPWRYA